MQKKFRHEEEETGVVTFDSMITRFQSNDIHISHERLIQNGSLMLGAGISCVPDVLPRLEATFVNAH